MGLVDFDKLAQEYQDVDDFGFSAISKEDYDRKVTETADSAAEVTAGEYKKRLQELEKIVVPFLTKLHSTGDKEYIFWPNRKPIIEEQIQKILKLTRD